MDYDLLPAIALAQFQVRAGAPVHNVRRMGRIVAEARARGAEFVVFSEMCVSGYILGDLWESDELVRDLRAAGEQIRAMSEGITVVFGNVALGRGAPGEDGRLRKYNAVWVARDGHWLQREGLPPGLPDGAHVKTLHPNYRFFDDDRHFYSLRKLALEQGVDLYAYCEPYRVRLRDGREIRFGVQLCEDLWCQDYRYHGEVLDTLHAFHARGADLVFNLSASPWTWRKSDKRHRTVREVLRRSPVPFFYVNQVGAQNNGKNVLVFDGDTSAYDASGRLRARAEPWREALLMVPCGAPAPAPEQGELPALADAVAAGVRHLDEVTGRENGFLLGLSGGVDSSLVACLLVRALGPARVFGVNMPTRFNAEVTRSNARRLAERLGVAMIEFPIEDLYRNLAGRIRGAALPAPHDVYARLNDENLQARIRGADVLAGLAARHGLLFTNNGNKTEIALGYATLYGDVNGALAPIGDLWKTQVFELAGWLNAREYGHEVIPANLLDGTTVPSAELSAEQDVTRGLGDPIRYPYHDAVLRQLVEYRRHPAELLEWALAGELEARLALGAGALGAWFTAARDFAEDLEWVERALRTSYFKRVQAPPIVVLSKRAFGFDLRESQLPAWVPQRYTRLRELLLAAPWPPRTGSEGRRNSTASPPSGAL